MCEICDMAEAVVEAFHMKGDVSQALALNKLMRKTIKDQGGEGTPIHCDAIADAAVLQTCLIQPDFLGA